LSEKELRKLIIDAIRSLGARVEEVEDESYIIVEKEGERYISLITPVLNIERLKTFHVATRNLSGYKREIIVYGEIKENADEKAKLYGIDITTPRELYSFIGKYVINKILSGENISMEEGKEEIKLEELDVEAEWEEEGEEEEVVDGIPIFLEEIDEGEEGELYPIIKPSLLNKIDVANHLLENGIIYAEVPKESIKLELVPYYIFTYTAKIYVENEETVKTQQGLVCINSISGDGHILKEGLLTVNSLPDVDKRYSAKIDDITAMEFAREIVKKEYTMEKEITREMGSVTVFEKVKMYPKRIDLKLENIFYYPIWRVEMIGREIIVDGVSKKIIKSS